MLKSASAVLIMTLSFVAATGFETALYAQSSTQIEKLEEMSRELNRQLQKRRTNLYYDLIATDRQPQKQLNENPDVELIYIDESGKPRFYAVENLNAARTISTDDVWPGGSGGFSLTGAGTTLGELAVWDGGGVLTTHQELASRVTQMDSPGGTHYHSTHVAGTMIASGVKASARGMSYQGTLAAYDWDYDDSEMAAAAATGMNVSSHSYGYITGWYYSYPDWYWFGDISISTTEDYGFGFYDYSAQAWDSIAYNAPYYTIAKSAGNDRNDDGPGPGGEHYVYDGSDWVLSTDTRDPDGGTDGYDCVSWNGTAKNIITVGAVEDIPGGYSAPGDVVISSFSGWGPTDDGRIKPDLVANGISLYSCYNTNDTSYASLSGTSMSTPNLSGSLNLLIRYYESSHSGVTPRAATMKAILVQTADEAGSYAGPDYMFGWGLMNTLKAAQAIQADSIQPGLIVEESLTNGEIDEYFLYSDGTEPIVVTLAWTDPPGTPPSPALNPTTRMLVNDLDLRLQHVSTSTIYYPYILNPALPANPAGTGDNIRDNTEHVEIQSPPAGSYRITVSHKGTLSSPQYYSLVKSQEMIDEPGFIAGTVTDNQANPLNDVYVLAVSTMVDDSTDVGGNYNLDSLNAGAYDVSFSHPDYSDTIVTGINVTPGDTATLNVVMQGLPGSLTGVVYDAASGDSIQGVHVVLIGTTYEDFTNPSGQYMFFLIEPGTYDISFSHPDYRDTIAYDIVLPPNDLMSFNMPMTVLPGHLSGFVYDQTSGDSIPGVHVVLDGTGSNTYTDQDGYYSFININPDTYSLTLAHPDYRDTTVADVVITPDDTTYRDVAIDQLPGIITGTVFDIAAGDSIQDVHIIIQGLGTETYTDQDGQYLLDNIEAGTYSISFSHSDYSDTVVAGIGVTPGDTTILDVGMEILPSMVFGTVTDLANGDSISEVMVMIEGTGLSDQTDADGFYSIDSIQPGTYNLSFSHQDYGDTIITDVVLNPGESSAINVELNLLPGLISGTVDEAGLRGPITDVHVVALGAGIDDYTDIDGEYALGGLSAGLYDVSFAHDGYVDTTIYSVEVTPGDTTELNVLMNSEGGYFYLPGDANMYMNVWPPTALGADATYLINYFRGVATSQPCLLDGFWAAADANGDCDILGSDVTKLVNFFRGTGSIEYCPAYPPQYPPVPDDPPPGWPNCEGLQTRPNAPDNAR